MSLINKIADSDAFASILFEKKIEGICLSNNWSPTHSAHFSDPNSNKIREVDIIARQMWLNGKKQVYVNVYLAIECKSNVGYSVLLTSGRSKLQSIVRLNRFWIGDETYTRNHRLQRVFTENNITDELSQKILKKFEKIAFPDGHSSISDFKPQPNPINHYSSYKETNTKITRDTETSVIYKAFQSLTSCVNGFLINTWNNTESELTNLISFCNKKELPMNLIRFFNNTTKELTIIHPILVIDSTLLTINDNKPIEIKQGRLERRNIYNHCDAWIDIVNSSQIESYIKELDNYYETFYSTLNMTRRL